MDSAQHADTVRLCCEYQGRTGSWHDRPQIVVQDKLRRFGSMECPVCKKTFGVFQLVFPSAHIGPVS